MNTEHKFKAINPFSQYLVIPQYLYFKYRGILYHPPLYRMAKSIEHNNYADFVCQAEHSLPTAIDIIHVCTYIRSYSDHFTCDECRDECYDEFNKIEIDIRSYQ